MIRIMLSTIRFHSFLLLAGTLISCLLSQRVVAQNSQDLKLQLKWHHQFQFAGYYAAQIKGFYKEAGLNVELIEGDESNPVNKVLSGSADFGITGSDIINSHLQNKPVVVISTIFQHSPYVFITLANSKISSASDLAGKKLMASEDQGWLLLRAVFLSEGIPIDNIKLIKHSWNNQDLISGKVDAFTGYSTVEPYLIRKMGHAVNLIRPADYGIDFYGDVLFTSRSMSDEHPELVEKFNAASIKGWHYAMSHQQEIADYILTLPGVKDRNLKKEDLLNEAKEMQALILPELVEIGHMNPGRWQSMLNVYKKLGIAPKGATIEGFLFQSSSTKKILYYDILLYILGIGLSLFVIALIWNWQLRKIVHKKTIELQNEISVRRNAEQRLELAIEAAGLGIWRWNVAANEFDHDHKWIQSLGYEPQQFLKNFIWTDIVHPDDVENVKDSMRLLTKGKPAPNSLAYRIKTSEGSWKWVLSFSKITGLNEDGTAEHVIGTHLDVDFIKGKEIELQDITNELRKKNTELEKFAYITSHNLRAPVVNLMSLAEIQSDEHTTEELNKEITEKIHYCVKQLDSTLNDLVEIVASKSGANAQRELLDLKNEFDSTARGIEKQLKESRAQIDVNFAECKSIYYPKQFLQSIFLNLLTNAIKYRSEHRKLVISLKTRVKKDYTILYFSDNGLGIDMAKYGHKIFGLYQRFHSKIEGKGLGLYIIKSQIESLDGKIEVDSMPDVGTTFKMFFKNPVVT